MRALTLLALFAACNEAGKKPDQATPAPAALTPAIPATPAIATAEDPMLPPAPDAPPTDLVKGANQFALALWQHMPHGNLAVSPASVAIPLTIAWGGSRGTTQAQLHKTLGLPGERHDVLLSRYGKLARSLVDGSRQVTLKIANRLYAEKTYEVDTTYFTIARHAFDVWIEPVDFIGSADAVREKINTWVAEQTEQRIKDLVSPRSLSAATKLVIVNAIYFLGDWATPFDKALTQPRDFWVNGTTKKQVPTMFARRTFRYANGSGASLIELPYKGNSLAMYVVVPDARDGIAKLDKHIEPTLRTLQPKLADQDVALTLPTFTIDPPDAMKLDQPLQALGMKDAFDPQAADFTGLANPKDPTQRLYVSSVIHKAFVKVDEKGTEAAAATAIAAPGGGPPPKATELHVDHPFLFAIVDKPSGLILFLGRVVDPK